MKSITVIGLLICVLPAKVSADLASEVEMNLKAIFELWKTGEIHNRVPFKLPPVEPLPLPPFCDNINKLGVKAYVQTGILQFYGLKAMSIDALEVSETAHDISVTIRVPKLRIHSDSYNIKGKAMYVYNVKGSGTMDITLYNVKGNGKIHLNPTATGTEIKQLMVKVECERAEGNLQDASWPINNLINTKGRQLVESFKVEIQKIAMKQVQNVFQEPLSKIKFDDLLQYTKDILDNSLLNRSLKRSGSLEISDNSTVNDFQNGFDVSTVTVVENGLDDSPVTALKGTFDNSTMTDVEDNFDNSTDFRKILKNGLSLG